MSASRTTDESGQPELLHRLDLLEDELGRLRRELGVETAKRTELPAGDFKALRMRLGDEFYGVPIAWVREIARYVQLTNIADVPAFVAGTINLRGEILPVIDGRTRFGLKAARPRRGTAIVLFSVSPFCAGLVVDGVDEVVQIAAGNLSEPTGPLASAKGVAALATVGDEVIQVVDVARLMSSESWQQVASALSNPPTAGTRAIDSVDQAWDSENRE